MIDYIKREKSNSITHLVKIVAKEVFEESRRSILDDILNETNILFRSIDTRLTHQENIHSHKTSEHNLSHTHTDFSRARFDWSSNEDDALKREVRDSLWEIARDHKRSVGAIKSRIEQNWRRIRL